MEKSLTFIAVVVGVSLFYLQSAYGTVRPYEAIQIGFVEEFPKVLEVVSSKDPNIALMNLGRMLLDPSGDATSAIASSISSEIAQKSGYFGCIGHVGWREFDPNGYRTMIAEKILDGVNAG